MITLQTKVNIDNPEVKLNYNSKIFLIGSCFSENIGEQLSRYKFNIIKNPFGVLYNPVSISNALLTILKNKKYEEDQLDFYNDKWFSFDHHTSFSSENKSECLTNINKSVEKASLFLKDTDVLIITLGTSYVYRQKESGKIVSNCHKIPASQFTHEFLDQENSFNIISNALAGIIQENPKIYIIFTVSPIRHWKDGAVQNQWSKASLLLTIKKILKEFERTYYFPSYEIFMDELRDYRFYDKDLLHPSNIGKIYIWDKFKTTFTDNNTEELLKKTASVVEAFEHKPFWPNSQEYQKFARATLKQIRELEDKLPPDSFIQEKTFFNHIIENH